MARRLGLQARMTISFVLATVAIVVFVEALAGAIVLPRLTSGSDATVKVLDLAGTLAKEAAGKAVASGQLTLAAVDMKPGSIAGKVGDQPIPFTKSLLPPGRLEPFELVLDTKGRIISTTYPARYPVGADAQRLLPANAVDEVRGGLRAANPKLGAAAVAVVPDGKMVWALAAIRVPLRADTFAVDIETSPKAGSRTGTIGFVYVQTPAKTGAILASSRLGSGALLLVLTIPVGALFGLLTTRGLRRRLRRLADASQAVAGGDFTTRLAPASNDEVGQLERNFNDMTARLGEATERELELASQNARLAERSRISRELHDSISQDLFSLALLSGGLQRALPSDSPLQAQMSQIAETVATAIHEMRALVLDIHPSALADKGLGPALEDLCASYRARLGLDIESALDPVELDTAAQHAVLRVAQEALANAVKHADATSIAVQLRAVAGGTELVVTDDGRGFDPSAPASPSGVGLRLMRERISELGGSLEVDSRPGGGTTLRAVLPPSTMAPGLAAQVVAGTIEPAAQVVAGTIEPAAAGKAP